MEIGKAFTYVFEDPKWIMKVLIGGIVGIIPIVNFAALGFMLTTLKNVAEGQPTPMPEWSDFGAHFMKGLYGVIGALVYFLPAIVVFCCVFIVGIAATTLASSGSKDAAQAAGGIVPILTICLQCVGYLLELVAFLALWAPMTRFAMSANQLNLFWDFKGNMDFIKSNLSNYFISLALSFVATFVAGFGIILCIVGVFFTYFWAYMVSANLWGQMWRASMGKGTMPAMA